MDNEEIRRKFGLSRAGSVCQALDQANGAGAIGRLTIKKYTDHLVYSFSK